MPQLLLSAVFITKTNQFDVIVVISFISSLWSLTSRVAADDKGLLEGEWKSLDFTYKNCPCVNIRYIFRVFVRFLEISTRVSLLTLMWINIGGMGTGIIIALEFIYLLITCVIYKAIMNMGNLMYFVFDDGSEHSGDFDIMWVIFIIYRLISSYIYLVIVTCFANISFEAWKVDDYTKRHANTMNSDKIGFFLFLYSWIGFLIWPCSFYCLKETAMINNSLGELYNGRDFITLYQREDYFGICEMIEMGRKLSKWDWDQIGKVLIKKYGVDDEAKEYLKQLLIAHGKTVDEDGNVKDI